MSTQKINVLILEDQQDEAKIYKRIVNGMGLECEYVCVSQDALKYLEENTVHILLLDIYLGEKITGIDLIPKIKEMCPAVLIIVITHVIDIQDPINAIRAGAFDYMLKPLDITLFQQRMQIAVDKVKYEYTKKKVKELLPSDLI